MTDRTRVLIDPWLGEVSRYRDSELIGSIEVSPATRAPRQNGQQDLEFVIEVAPPVTGPALDTHVSQCAARFRLALAGLDSIKQYAVNHAPEGWAAQYAPHCATLTDLLFLDGLEADRQSRVSLVFDFGDLGQLVVRLDEHGHGAATYVRP
jgi:hypothetical protein